MSFWDFTADKESSFQPLPQGVYNLAVTDVEQKQTKAGDPRLAMTFTVLDGEFTGRRIFEGYNLGGNEKAVQIARGNLKSLLKAGGKSLEISGPEEFRGIEITASVKVQAGKDGYADRNTISSFKPKTAQAESSVQPF